MDGNFHICKSPALFMISHVSAPCFPETYSHPLRRGMDYDGVDCSGDHQLESLSFSPKSSVYSCFFTFAVTSVTIQDNQNCKNGSKVS